MKIDRVVIAGEDRAHGDFLRRYCRQVGWTVVDEQFAPRGAGAASDWVIRTFPDRLEEVRGGGYPGLALLTAIDGDNRGRARRLSALADACATRGLRPLKEDDSAAILVPCWCIETWALFFESGTALAEDDKGAKSKAKRLFRPPHPGFAAPGVPRADAPRVWKPGPLAALVSGFASTASHASLPALDASRVAVRRLQV